MSCVYDVCCAIVICAVAVVVSSPSPTPSLYLQLPSSRVVPGEAVHSFGSGDYSVLETSAVCPFTIGASNGGELSVSQSIDFSAANFTSQCVSTPSGYLPTLISFYCLVIHSDTTQSYGIFTIISITPDLTQLEFPQPRYSGVVTEGTKNALVSVSGLRVVTTPLPGLLLPEYRITGDLSDMFSISQEAVNCDTFPLIYTSTALNRTQQLQYNITLEAFSGDVTAATILSIYVLDINDHPPVPVAMDTSLSIEESALPGSHLATVEASDLDSGSNGIVRYSLASLSAHLTVHPFTGSLYLYSTLDHETDQTTSITLSLQDYGQPTLNAQRNLTIFIDDVNECPPLIHVLETQPVVEGGIPGGLVAKVEVSDADSPPSSLSLALSSSTCDCFQLSSSELTPQGLQVFSLTLTTALDYESFPEGYLVLLAASDNDTPTLTTAYELHVPVTDLNESPYFPLSDYQASVPEGAPTGTEVIRMVALDPDIGTNAELTYEISSLGAYGTWFEIDTESGVVYTTTANTDHGLVDSVELIVEATDTGGEHATTTLIVAIEDVNNHRPSLANSDYSVTIPETLTSTDTIFVFSATDNDSLCNGGLRYSLLHSEPPVFRVDSLTGALYPLHDSSLDYETFQIATVVVQVQDQGERWNYSTYTTLTMQVDDVDDEQPVVDPIDCPCWISENTSGEQCQPLTAHDPDSSILTFHIQPGNETERFTIDQATGVVNPLSPLDREEQDEYVLMITASDQLRQSDPQLLRVIVLDENDSPPSYDDSLISILIPHDLPVGGCVGSVAAEHPDVGFNGLTEYSFASNTQSTVRERFGLDSLSGQLYLKQDLPDVLSQSFNVIAKDLLDPSQQDGVDVTVTVEGTVNHPPAFAVSSERILVAANHQVGMDILQLSAMDPDDNELIYSLMDGNTLFTLEQSGLLRLTHSLLFQAGAQYTLNVACSDGTHTAYQEVAIVVYATSLSVGGVEFLHNSGVPVCHVTGSIPEHSGEGVEAISLPETQSSETLDYSILDQEIPSAFRLNGFKLESEGGFEQDYNRREREAIQLTLRAIYGINFYICSVTVLIEDSNDLGPVFHEDQYSIEVYRATPIGASVFQFQAIDEDIGANAETEYTLLTSPSMFELRNTASGVLQVKGQLTNSEYTLMVQATDSHDPNKIDTTTLTVIILEISNTQPSSPTLNPLSLDEATPLGPIDRTASVDDPDSGVHMTNNYCIRSGNRYDLFGVDQSGNILVKRPLDFESYPPSFSLEVVVFDASPNPQFNSATLAIQILARNDENPVFTAPNYTATVGENLDIGAEVVTVEAIDLDGDSVGYSILESNTPFTISDSGGITTALRLNREADAFHSLTVMATDQERTSVTTVTILVLDDNDIDPIWDTPSQTQTLPESTAPGSTLLPQLKASDDDEGANGVLWYSIVSGNDEFVFLLDPWTGTISLERSLDYERDAKTYSLVFAVRDLGSPSRSSSSTVTVTYQLTNTNDHYPVFSQSLYACNITSEMFDSPCQVDATDDDMDIVQYTIASGGNGKFTIDTTSGSLFLSAPPLDVESPYAIPLVVLAVDTGTPALTSSVLVVVMVIDSNDHLPDIHPPSPSVLVPESAPLLSLLFFVHAEDRDGGVYGEVEYFNFIDNDPVFSVDKATGAVFLSKQLDFENAPSHTLRVLASNIDNGAAPPFTYTIEVMDVDENTLPPLFPAHTPSAITVSRGTETGTTIAMVMAVDSDPGPDGVVSYSITGGSGSGYFHIDANTGNISLSRSLSAVWEDSLSLTVTASDGSSFPLSSTHSLLLLLQPDPVSKPLFLSPEFHATIPENQEGVIFAHVLALTNGNAVPDICYSIIGGNEGGEFAVNTSTGAVSVPTGLTLDYERQSLYNLALQASRTGVDAPSTSLLVVEVLNVNEGRPEFPSDYLYNVALFESFPALQEVMRVFAVDEDSELEYTIVSPEDQLPFNISSTTGGLYLTESLEGQAASNYTFSVRAEDSAGNSRSVQVTIMITATVTTSQHPFFTEDLIVIDLLEDSPPGQVYSVQPENQGEAPLMYWVNEPPSQFAIHPNSGQVYLTQPLDREESLSFTLDIKVWDGTTVDPVSFSLVVRVTDINDNRPALTLDSFSFAVEEHSLLNQTIGAITANDRDDLSTANAVLSFSLVDAEHPSSLELFQVGEGGELRVAGELDREVIPTHTLTVAVTDGGEPPLVTYGKVTVTITDINDHSPVFLSSFHSVSIAEDAPVGTTVFTAVAFDPDTSSNAQIAYSLQPANTPLSLDPSTGEVTISEPLDAEAQTVYTLTITAYHPVDVAHSSLMQLNVSVLDVLDSLPSLLLPSGPITLRENLPPYTTVTSLTAQGNTRPVYYRIVAGNELQHFFIEPLTGIVRTSTALDREAVSSYELSLCGAYGPGFESTVTLGVSVMDENDSPPSFPSPILMFTLSLMDPTPLPLGVTDLDDGANGQVGSYLIPDPWAAQYFTVSPSGSLTLNPPTPDQAFSTITFNVYAFDSGFPELFSKATVTVTISEPITSPPVFSLPEYQVTVSIPVTVGAPLFTVSASGAGQVIYSIVGGSGSERFEVNALSGALSITDNYHLQSLYTLELAATDSEERGGQTTVTVSVRECGYRGLAFTTRRVTLEVSEDIENGSVVYQPDIESATMLEFIFSLPTAPTFSLDPATGTITVEEGLDREDTPLHQLVLQARDSTNPERIAQVDIELTVTDVNDNKPVFLDTPYSASVAKDAEVGKLVLTVSAEDPDLANTVTYEILISEFSALFDISPENGMITVGSSLLGTELGSTIVLTVQASDSLFSPQTLVSVNILDPNAPAFTQNIYRTNISESASRGMLVFTVEATVASGSAEITYSIEGEGEGPPLPFYLDALSGEVTVNDRELDYDSVSFYQINLLASGLSSLLTGRARLDVTILDENDISPSFTQFNYPGSICENTVPGTIVLTVTATDGDSTPNAQVNYELEGEGGLFLIDADTGVITTATEVDYEDTPLFELTVLALDSGSPRQTGSTTVTVTVVNLNDNPPIFVQSLYSAPPVSAISALPDSTLLLVRAEDSDQDPIVYGIVPGPGSGNFAMSSTGLLSLNSAINLTEFQYLVNVSACDGTFCDFTVVVIEVDLGNAHTPVFNQTSYSASVLEGTSMGVLVAQVFASDEDQGSNGEITYTRSNFLEGVFSMDPVNGLVTTAGGKIDREETPVINMVVTARDGGGKSGTANVKITILDINDNAPAFTQQQYITNVVESSVTGIPVLSVVAMDPDAGANGTVAYTISDTDDQFPFVIDSNGLITLALDVDHERTQEYSFSVTASDMGDPPLTSEMAVVTVHVLDTLDTPPMFEQDPYNISLPERTSPDTTIATVRTTGSVACERLTYSVTELNLHPFDIISHSGDVVVIQFLRRVEGDVYNFFVEAECDVDSGVLRSFVAVTVHVLDINEKPDFDPGNREFIGSIPENSEPFTFITGEIQAVDNDLGENKTVTLELIFINGSVLMGVPFEIIPTGPLSGALRSTGPLDHETVSQYSFYVRAVDHGSPPLTSSNFVSVQIDVSDINDSPPEFSQEHYFLELREDALPETIIFRAAEFVSDEDDTGTFSYIVAGADLFQVVESTGEVSTTAGLDRESTAAYTLLLTVNDGASTASAFLHINVTDANDNRPVFDLTDYPSYFVPEDFPVHTTFLQVVATDADEGENAIISYSFVDNDGHFAINSSSGEISFAQAPDYEVPSSRRLEVRVRASDGAPDTSDQQLAKVVVLVGDVNDNSPVFNQDSYNFSVMENSNITTIVGTVSAIDADGGANGFVMYCITGAQAPNFNIHQQNGNLRTQKVFDREAEHAFELVVTATDGGNSSLSSNVTVFVSVEDENDNAPTFPQSSYTVNVSELWDPVDAFLTVHAEDSDAGDNGDISYSLGPGETQNVNDVFFLTETSDGSASLFIKEQLNHENIQRYSFTLFASDRGLPSRQTGTASILVVVVDENDNEPMFSKDTYSVDVREDEAVGSTIVTVFATDLDATDNTQLVYSIQEALSVPELLMNSTSGGIQIVQPLDFEERCSYTLTVIASDRSDSAMAMVNIDVLDVNDNSPHFTTPQEPVHIINILENLIPGDEDEYLIKFVVEDQDTVEQSDPALVTFSILSGNEQGRFELESASGVLRVLVSLDREELDGYLLVVGAEDHGTPSLTGSVNISVVVGDLNDNPPQTETQVVFIFLYQGELASTLLGTVFVQDPDTTNDHHFAISSPDASNFFHIDQEGQITITQTPLPGAYSLSVTVTDTGFLEQAITTVQVQVGSVSMETTSSSFTMQLGGVTLDTFVVDKLQNFISTVESLITMETTLSAVELQVFSIQPSESGGFVEVVLAVQTPDGGYVHPTLAQHVLHVSRSDVEQSLGIQVVTELVDPCAEEVCESGEECSVAISYSLSSEPLGLASSVTYLGLLTSSTTSCGGLPSPCASLTCPEPSYCMEEKGLATCLDDCSTKPCKSNGNCIPQTPGYYCSCPEGFDGRNCELTVATFQGSSYAVFPSLDQRSEGAVSVEIISGETHGLLVYSGRFDSTPGDFLALELLEGFPTLRVSYGGEITVVSLGRRVDDRVWHFISAEYNSSVISLTATTFDPYKKDGETKTVKKDFHALDLGAPVIVGDLPDRLKYDYLGRTFTSFTGCMRNVIINGQLLDFSEPLEEEGVVGGCGFTDPHCSPTPCKNGGECTGTWSSSVCDCTPFFKGSTCTSVSPSASFTGEGFIQYQVKTTSSSKRRLVRQGSVYSTGRNFISLAFIASGDTGTILQLGAPGGTDYAILEIAQGYLQFVYSLGSGEGVARQPTVKVNDGALHNVTVERVEQAVEVIVDESYVARAISPGNEATLDISSGAIYLGALVDFENKPTNGFSGCLRGVKVDRKDLPVGGETEDFIAMPSATGIKESACPAIELSIAPTESSQQAGYVYGGLVGILVTLAAVVVCFVFATVVVRRRKGRKRSTRHLSTVAGGQASPSALAWHPTDSMRGRHRFRNDSISGDFVLESINKNSNNTQQFFHTPSSPSPISSPTLSETAFVFATEQPLASQDPGRAYVATEQPLASQDPSRVARPTTEHRMSSPIRAELGHSRSPSYPQQPSGKNRQESDIPPPPYHTRSASEQQSIVSMRSEGGHSSIYHDDTEVGKYIRKQKEAADGQVEEVNLDEMKPFKEEGKFEPLGSIGSLHDITMATEDGEGGDESILSTRATISSHELSHMSKDSPDMGGYGRRLDKLMERLHNLTTDPAHPTVSPPTSQTHQHSNTMRIV